MKLIFLAAALALAATPALAGTAPKLSDRFVVSPPPVAAPAEDPRDTKIAELTLQVRRLSALVGYFRAKLGEVNGQYQDQSAMDAAASAIAQQDAAAAKRAPAPTAH